MKKAILIFAFLMAALPAMAVEIYDLEIPTRVEDKEKKYLAAGLVSSDTVTPRPVIFIQTPYNMAPMLTGLKFVAAFPGTRGGFQLPIDTNRYNYVIMDWRGFFQNAARAIPTYDRGLDGYDAVEWIAQQKWCNGKIATWGASALGVIQFQTARHNPPHLVCINPHVKGFKQKYTQYYKGGVLLKEHFNDLTRLGYSVQTILDHTVYDIYWELAEGLSEYAGEIQVPALMIGGWYDLFPADMLRDFEDLRQNSHPDVRNRHKIVMGPWLHSHVGKKEQGALEYPEAVDYAYEISSDFFDYYLLGAKNGYPLQKPVQFFLMGKNQWLKTDGIPPKTDTTKLYLHPDMKLKSTLVMTESIVAPKEIVFAPRDPSPTYGGCRLDQPGEVALGPQDLRDSVESRGDALVFSTEPLEQDITLNGGTRIILYVSSDREDTDFAVRLADVYPDGRSMLLRSGIKRVRFRNGYDREDMMEPGEVYEIEITIDDLAITFLKGHQVRIVVTCSNYPQYDINLNNGEEINRGGDTLVALNKLHWNEGRQPRVELINKRFGDIDGIEDDHAGEGFRLYPNPADERLSVEIPWNQAKIEVFDYLGSRRLSLDAFAGIQKLDISALPVGAYILKITAGNKRLTEIFLKR